MYFPTSLELDTCLEETGLCNKILLDRIEKWMIENEKSDQDFCTRETRTVNLNGKQGRQLAGDEWMEDFLVQPVKQFSFAQSSFAMELMSCSINLLEANRQMYKG